MRPSALQIEFNGEVLRLFGSVLDNNMPESETYKRAFDAQSNYHECMEYYFPWTQEEEEEEEEIETLVW